MGMLSSLNLVFNYSHITQASFSEFVIDGHYYTSPNQPRQPSTLTFSDSESLSNDVSPTQLRKRVWALHHSPCLPFTLNSPFHGSITFSRFITTMNPEQQTHTFKLRYISNLVRAHTDFWSTESLWSCFHASTVQNDSLPYLLGVSHNITESVKPFWNMKQRQINAEKQLSLRRRLGKQNSEPESNLMIGRRVWVLQLQG